ncbi:MAG: hypothetical protein V3T72_06980 [Thermoanaerobaculia bacterium]
MEQIEEYQRRLATLSIGGCDSLAACRAFQNGLRKLKRDVLAQILTLRTKTRKQAREAMKTEPSLRNLWKWRSEIVDEVVSSVKERLTGDSDDDEVEAVEAWAGINREIDSRLDRLDALERRLAKDAGQAVARRPCAASRPRIGSPDSGGDDLYAAAGAEAQKRRRTAALCPECGGTIEAGDRFCGRCGNLLG